MTLIEKGLIVISFASLVALIPSLLCFVGCFYLARASIRSWAWRIALTLLHLFSCAMSAFYLVADSLSGNGIDESVFFHIFYGMEGAGTSEFTHLYILGAVLVLLSLAGAYWIIRVRAPVWRANRAVSAAMVFGVFFSFLLNPASKDLARYLAQMQFVDSASDFSLVHLISDDAIGSTGEGVDDEDEENGTQFEEFYIEPNGISLGTARPNIVFVYLESFERTYLNEAAFPGLVKHIRKYERSALNFSGLQQVYGTGWTIGGIVSSQCGIPLVTTGAHGNAMEKMDEFLPGARCLGEVLRDEGYHLVFRGGADLNFAGKGKFLRNHGFADIKGLHELVPSLKDPTYLNSWGLYDDSLLDEAYQNFLTLSKGPQPFGLFLLTVDTHHPEGHIPRSCTDAKYRDGENAILNAVKCSDQVVARFLDRVFASPYAANTMVVIVSDHLAMPNTARDTLEELDRKNVFMIVPPGGVAPRLVTRRGSTLDISPTVLHVLTGKPLSVGLGRSLLDSSSQSLVEQMGDQVDSRLKSWSMDIRRFWRLPQISEPVQVTATERTLAIGGRTVRYPTLIHLDADLNIRKIFFPDEETSLHQRAYAKPGARVIWVDNCKTMQVLSTKLTPETECLLVGMLGSKSVYVQPVTRDFDLPVEVVQKAVLGSSVPF